MECEVRSTIATVGGNKFPLIFNPENRDTWVEFHSMVLTIACAYPELKLTQKNIGNGQWAVIASKR